MSTNALKAIIPLLRQIEATHRRLGAMKKKPVWGEKEVEYWVECERLIDLAEELTATLREHGVIS